MSQDNDKRTDLQKRVDEVKELHQQWIKHPMTQMCLGLIGKFREIHVNTVSANVTNIAVSDSNFRGMAINIKNTDAIVKLITDSELFVSKQFNLDPTVGK